MTASVLIDTNILVYAYDKQSGSKQHQALNILNYWIKSKQASVSTQVLAEFSVVATNRLEPPLNNEELLTRIDSISNSCKVYPVTYLTVREAVRGMHAYQLSYWDAQLWAVARLNQVSVILTEDLPSQSFIEGITYKNPFDNN